MIIKGLIKKSLLKSFKYTEDMVEFCPFLTKKSYQKFLVIKDKMCVFENRQKKGSVPYKKGFSIPLINI